MSERLTNHERAQIASHYEVWKSVVQVQRWWREHHERRACLDSRTIKTCHSKLMTTGSVKDAPRSGRPSKSKAENDVELLRKMFDESPHKSTHRAARKVVCPDIQSAQF